MEDLFCRLCILLSARRTAPLPPSPFRSPPVALVRATVGDMPPEIRHHDEAGQQQHGAPGDRVEALCDSRNIASCQRECAGREAFAELEEERRKTEEERFRLLAEAHRAAAKVKHEAATGVEDMRREIATSCAAIAAEQAAVAVEEATTFQTSKVLLNVGGHRFET
mmetsp:Transcript_27305/g.68355  ORF Transcript_27305/g.68355 Transcript_27305/m.68355 type:complete len:166 (-) Transcript_27305:312-809(-)